MCDPYSDNDLIYYYTIIFSFVTYYLLDLYFSYYSLPRNDRHLSWTPGLPPAGPAGMHGHTQTRR